MQPSVDQHATLAFSSDPNAGASQNQRPPRSFRANKTSQGTRARNNAKPLLPMVMGNHKQGQGSNEGESAGVDPYKETTATGDGSNLNAMTFSMPNKSSNTVATDSTSYPYQ